MNFNLRVIRLKHTSAAHLKCCWCDRERVLGACGARTRAVAPASLQVPFESHADLRTALYIHFWTSNFHFFDRNPPNGPQKCTIYTLLDTEFHSKSNLHSSKMPSKWSQSAIYSAFWLKGWIHCLIHPVLVGLYSKKEGDRFAVAIKWQFNCRFFRTVTRFLKTVTKKYIIFEPAISPANEQWILSCFWLNYFQGLQKHTNTSTSICTFLQGHGIEAECFKSTQQLHVQYLLKTFTKVHVLFLKHLHLL